VTDLASADLDDLQCVRMLSVLTGICLHPVQWRVQSWSDECLPCWRTSIPRAEETLRFQLRMGRGCITDQWKTGWRKSDRLESEKARVTCGSSWQYRSAEGRPEM